MTKTRKSDAPPNLNWIIAATSFGFVVVQLDVSIVNLALPHIGRDLHAEISGLQWVVDAYTLFFASLLLSAGAVGDRVGAKRVFLAAFGLFALASLACGLAPTVGALIAARVVQGIGAAGLVPPSLALLVHACEDDHKRRATAIGLWTAASGFAVAAGPVVGGFLIQWLGWRSIFLVNLPLTLIGVALTWRFVPDTPRNSHGRHLDLKGQALAVVTLLSFTAAIIEIGPSGIASALVIGLFALGIVSAAVFLRVEARGDSPMLPLHFFRNRTFSAATAAGTLVNLSFYGVIFVLSLYLQQVKGYGVIPAGLAFLPLTATFILVNVVAGQIVSRVGSRIPMVVGFLICATGFLWLRMLDAATPYWLMVPGFFLIPGGMGTAVPAMTAALLASVERKWSGTASGVLNTARQAGGTVGVAVFGTLVGQHHETILSGLHASVTICAGLLLLAAAISFFGIGRTRSSKGDTAR